MNIKNAAIKIIALIKTSITDITSGTSNRNIDDNLTESDIHMDEMIPEQQPLNVYESRRKEIEESGEPIEGIFYLYDGQIIPDYYSECLFSDRNNNRRTLMYHSNFFPNYIWKKYNGLTYGVKSLPRGRIVETGAATTIYIDKCYFNDTDTISKLKQLYRLSGRIDVMSYTEYHCPACYNRHGRQRDYDDIMAYTFCE